MNSPGLSVGRFQPSSRRIGSVYVLACLLSCAYRPEAVLSCRKLCNATEGHDRHELTGLNIRGWQAAGVT